MFFWKTDAQNALEKLVQDLFKKIKIEHISRSTV